MSRDLRVTWIGLLGGADVLDRGWTPWSASPMVRKSAFSSNSPGMAVYRRRLPHDYETDQPIFLTWRLHDKARSGPFYLGQPAITDMVVEAIQYNAAKLEHYVLHAFVVMPNHVHLLATPALALPKLTKSLIGNDGKLFLARRELRPPCAK